MYVYNEHAAKLKFKAKKTYAQPDGVDSGIHHGTRKAVSVHAVKAYGEGGGERYRSTDS